MFDELDRSCIQQGALSVSKPVTFPVRMTSYISLANVNYLLQVYLESEGDCVETDKKDNAMSTSHPPSPNITQNFSVMH
jgi:hypothetical protein